MRLLLLLCDIFSHAPLCVSNNSLTSCQSVRTCLTPKWIFYGQSHCEGWNNILRTICPVVQRASVLFITPINSLLPYTKAWQASAFAFVWKQSLAKAQCPRPTPQSFLDVIYSLLTTHFPSLLSLISMSEFSGSCVQNDSLWRSIELWVCGVSALVKTCACIMSKYKQVCKCPLAVALCSAKKVFSRSIFTFFFHSKHLEVYILMTAHKNNLRNAKYQ